MATGIGPSSPGEERAGYQARSASPLNHRPTGFISLSPRLRERVTDGRALRPADPGWREGLGPVGPMWRMLRAMFSGTDWCTRQQGNTFVTFLCKVTRPPWQRCAVLRPRPTIAAGSVQATHVRREPT